MLRTRNTLHTHVSNASVALYVLLSEVVYYGVYNHTAYCKMFAIAIVNYASEAHT